MNANAWRAHVPSAPDLDAALLDWRLRPEVVRAAVVHADLAEVVSARLPGLLASGQPRAQAAALAVAHGLCARSLTDTVCEALPALTGVRDPLDPEQTLAHRALYFLIEIARPSHQAAQRAIRAAMAEPGLRIVAWGALGNAPASASLPHLFALLDEAPDLAGEVGTRYALVHTESALAASEILATAPLEVRQAYADTLEKHLKRIFAVKKWVVCRRALFGR